MMNYHKIEMGENQNGPKRKSLKKKIVKKMEKVKPLHERQEELKNSLETFGCVPISSVPSVANEKDAPRLQLAQVLTRVKYLECS